MDIQILAPVAGKDYPKTWNEFLDWFGSEEACLSYLERLRWPSGCVWRTAMLGSDVPAHVSMAGVQRVAALVHRWILGTHHGSVQPEHLDAYLDEFVFRFDRRTSNSRGMLFYRGRALSIRLRSIRWTAGRMQRFLKAPRRNTAAAATPSPCRPISSIANWRAGWRMDGQLEAGEPRLEQDDSGKGLTGNAIQGRG